MGVETTAAYVNDLNDAWPLGGDGKNKGDDHLRLIKLILKNTFSGFTGQVIVKGTEAAGATANDFVVTITSDTPPTGYQDGMIVLTKATHTSITASGCTIKVNALSALPLTGIRGETLMAGDIASGNLLMAIYDSGNSSFVLLTHSDRISRNGDTLTGILNIVGTLLVSGLSTFGSLTVTGSATGVTPSPGDNSTKLATTAFVVGLAMAAILPGQTGKGGLGIATDGTTADWRLTGGETLALQALGIW